MKQTGTFFVKGERIVLKKDGTWIADGIEITHEQTREAFFRAIRFDAKGNDEGQHYCLSTGYETLFIEIEDTPYFVCSLSRESGERYVAHLSTGQDMEVRADALEYRDDALYLTTPDKQKARFLSAAYYEILKDLAEDASTYYLTIRGQKAILAKKDGSKWSAVSRPGSSKQP